eukprot:3085676-Pleurochrysis_carterae.AAC.1
MYNADAARHLVDLCAAAIGQGMQVHLLLLGCMTARLAEALLKRVHAVAGTANMPPLDSFLQSIWL